jgi:hypothetical protein
MLASRFGGLGAQQAAIARFYAEYGHEVVETLVKKETGKGSTLRRSGPLDFLLSLCLTFQAPIRISPPHPQPL